MPRFVLCCHDAGGTVSPVVALGQALVRRGHDVIVLAQPSVRERVESVGCEFTPFASLPDYDHSKTFEDQLELIGAAIVGDGVGRDLLRLGADVFVVDANLAGALAAAESAPQPCAVLLHSLYATFVETWFADLWPLLEGGINATRAGFGLGDVHCWPDVFAPHERLLSVVPRVFDTDVATPDTMRWFGFLVPDEPAGHDRASVLVAFSTTHYAQQADVVARVEAALEGLDVVTTSREKYIPHAALLPHTDVMVTHGGLGSVAAALHHGVPLVCIPFDRDQPLNSSRVAALGAGVVLDAGTSIEDIRTAVQVVLDDDGYRRAAHAVDSGSRGADAAAADLESLL